MGICIIQPDFLEKNLPPKWGKWGNGPKIVFFFEIYEEFCHWFFLNLFYDESLYIICYIALQILFLEKILLLKYGLKFFSFETSPF